MDYGLKSVFSQLNYTSCKHCIFPFKTKIIYFVFFFNK